MAIADEDIWMFTFKRNGEVRIAPACAHGSEKALAAFRADVPGAEVLSIFNLSDIAAYADELRSFLKENPSATPATVFSVVWVDDFGRLSSEPRVADSAGQASQEALDERHNGTLVGAVSLDNMSGMFDYMRGFRDELVRRTSQG